MTDVTAERIAMALLAVMPPAAAEAAVWPWTRRGAAVVAAIRATRAAPRERAH